MFRKISLLLAVLTLLLVRPLSADVLVLVHGYASDARTWEFSGVNDVLQAHGWPRAGVLPAAPAVSSANKSYSVNLPAQAPLLVQADYLRAVLYQLRQYYPQEKLILAGHSAGGIVARLVLLGNNPFHVDELITIATPNLGTYRAAQGLDVVDSKPFFCPGPGIDMLKSVLIGGEYDYLRDSRPLLVDLLPAESGNVLAWLNQQPYPDITYYSVIRQSAFGDGDEMVPAYSQDMNNVPALHGRVRVVVTPSGHSLNPQDGILLAGILSKG